MQGIKKPNAPRLGVEPNNTPSNLKAEIHSSFTEEEIISTPLDDLYALLQSRLMLQYNDYSKGCELINEWRVKLVGVDKEEKLKKRRVWENEYYQKWRKDNDKRYEFRFKRVADADVIAWLDSQPNRSEYIKNLIRADKEKH